MGGRGKLVAISKNRYGIPKENRQFSTVDTLGGIKVVQDDVRSNNYTMLHSNKANTTYYAYSKEYKRIEKIYYYRNHNLYKSVDFKPNETPHVHYWDTNALGRKRHDKTNIYPLTERDSRLVQQALKYNAAINQR